VIWTKKGIKNSNGFTLNMVSMNFTKNKKVLSKDDTLKAAWERYWQNKQEQSKLKKEQEELQKTLIELTEFEEGSQTATFLTHKLSYVDKPVLVVPKDFDPRVFMAVYAEFKKVELDKAKLAKRLGEADFRAEVHAKGFRKIDVEFDRQYRFHQG